MPSPPRTARALVQLLLPAVEREPIVGDLDELFARRTRRDGVRAARRWYRRKAAASVLARWAPSIALRRLSRGRRSGKGARPSGFGRLSGLPPDALHGIRLAARSLWRTPVFTLAAVVTVAIGVGANAAVFGVTDRVPFRPVAGVGDPNGVAVVWFSVAGDPGDQRGALCRPLTAAAATFPEFPCLFILPRHMMHGIPPSKLLRNRMADSTPSGSRTARRALVRSSATIRAFDT